MGNHLHGAAAVISPAFLLENGPVNFSSGHIGIFVQTLIDEALIMPKIQVCFHAVVRNKDLAVLNGIHGAGIDVDIGIEFLHGDL